MEEGYISTKSKDKNKFLNNWKDYLLRRQLNRFLTESVYENFHPRYTAILEMGISDNSIEFKIKYKKEELK